MNPDRSISNALSPGNLPSVVLLGVRLHSVTSREAVDHIAHALDANRGGWVFTPNLDIVRMLVSDPEYVRTTARATLRLPDGMPLIWASRLQGTPLKERVAGSEIIWPLCERAARDGRRVFLLGGNPGVAEGAAKRLVETYPHLRIVGTECPPLGFEKNPAYLRQLESQLVEAAPDICFVGLPAGKQDRLIRQMIDRLPHTWFLGVGVTFSFVVGEVRKAPPWVRRAGMEWLYRLAQEPRRLGRRYLVLGIPFAFKLLFASLIARFRPAAAEPETPAASAPQSSRPL